MITPTILAPLLRKPLVTKFEGAECWACAGHACRPRDSSGGHGLLFFALHYVVHFTRATTSPASAVAGADRLGFVELTQRSTGIVGLVLPVDGDRVLLARHTYGPPIWALLGGTALSDEPPDVAARREVEEESGLQVTTERLVAICDVGNMMLFIFVGRVVAGTERRQREEIAELHWFWQDEIEHQPVFQVVPLVLASLRSRQGTHEPGLSLQMVAWPDGPPRPVFLVASGSSAAGDGPQ